MSARIVALVALATASAGCAPYSCGWDHVIDAASDYRVTLGEAYRTGATTALYSIDEDFSYAPVRSCGALDEFASGAVFDVQRGEASHPTADYCSMWPMTVTSPVLASVSPSRQMLDQRSNALHLALVRDFGGGCVADWELTFHSPGNDPFMAQTPSALPVVVAYRSLRAPAGTVAQACATLVGAPAAAGVFTCGDAFVSTMSTL